MLPNNDQLMEVVNKALDLLYVDHLELIQMNPSERSICSKLEGYLHVLLSDWDVDVEYNRDGINIAKRLGHDPEQVLMVPDIVVHQRGTDGINLLVIEAKKSDCSPTETDYKKLRDMTGESYKYHLGLLLQFGKTRDETRFRQYVGGNEVSS